MNGEMVRVGVVGTSWWADRVHLPSLRSHPQATLAAIAGRDPARAQAMAQKYGVERVFTDWRAMLAEARLDALVVSTPDDLHHPIALAALDAGLHVLCEKPLALNSTQARAMHERALARGLITMTFFTYHWLPQYRYLKQLADAGAAGAVRHAQFTYVAGYARSGDYGWRYDARRATGVLGDLGSHMIDLARWLVGDIARVGARLDTFVRRRDTPEPANDSAMLLVEFANGASGFIQASAVAQTGADHRQRTALHGALGTLEVEQEAHTIVHRTRDGDEHPQALPVPDEFWSGIGRERPFDVFTAQSAGPRAFVDAVLDGRAAAPDFHDGWQAQAVIDAAFAAHRSGAWQNVKDYL